MLYGTNQIKRLWLNKRKFKKVHPCYSLFLHANWVDAGKLFRSKTKNMTRVSLIIILYKQNTSKPQEDLYIVEWRHLSARIFPSDQGPTELPRIYGEVWQPCMEKQKDYRQQNHD